MRIAALGRDPHPGNQKVLMLVVDAVLVMRQCIDDAAVGDRALGAMFNHS